MRIEPSTHFGRTRDRIGSGGGSRGPWLQLLSAVMTLAGDDAELLHHKEQAWASATFSGARHRLALIFPGETAMTAGEAFLEALPEHEFTLPGHIVADAQIVIVEQDAHCLKVEAELLLLEDC